MIFVAKHSVGETNTFYALNFIHILLNMHMSVPAQVQCLINYIDVAFTNIELHVINHFYIFLDDTSIVSFYELRVLYLRMFY